MSDPISGGVHTLKGKCALVTGGNSGIGRGIALALAGAGAMVALSARRSPELELVAAEIRESGGQALAVTCDVTDPQQVDALKATVITELGKVDILVNNAGAAASHKFANHPDELWHKMLDVNLTSVYYLCKAFAPGMSDRGWGRIINIASVASKIGGKYIVAYTAAKHGVLGLTRALALELAPQVTVNAICPGYVDTPMTSDSIENIVSRTGMPAEQARKILEKTNPQHRLIEVDEVAAIAVFLAQESGRGITGQGINVDGGSVMF